MTIIEYLNILPEPYKTQALENYNTSFDRFNEYGSEGYSLFEAINWAFQWDKSPEGHDYWDDTQKKAEVYEQQWKRQLIIDKL